MKIRPSGLLGYATTCSRGNCHFEWILNTGKGLTAPVSTAASHFGNAGFSGVLES